jgi:carboxymethylenebutenolidase
VSGSGYVSLTVADGSTMRAWVARPDGTPKAGLIVLQEAFGVNPHIRDVAERFAREGYLALAPELFHRTGGGVEFTYKEFKQTMPHMQAMTDESIAADLQASFEWLKGETGLPVAAIGYCLGGRAACLATITLPLACGISYYGGGIGPSTFFTNLLDRLKDLQAPILLAWAGLDRHIRPDDIRAVEDALRDAGKPFVNIEFSYADHGFFCDARATYNPRAAAEVWALTLAFLKNHLT